MRQGCRESQRSYLGRPVVRPGRVTSAARRGLRRQETAEAIVPVPSDREGLNVKEDEYFEQLAG